VTTYGERPVTNAQLDRQLEEVEARLQRQLRRTESLLLALLWIGSLLLALVFTTIVGLLRYFSETPP
jgi:hypothetical protein